MDRAKSAIGQRIERASENARPSVVKGPHPVVITHTARVKQIKGLDYKGGCGRIH